MNGFSAQLDILQKKLEIVRAKHEELVGKLSKVAEQEKTARQARREADQAVNEKIKKLNKVNLKQSLIKLS